MAQNKYFYTKPNECNLTAEKQGCWFQTIRVHSTCKILEFLKDSDCKSRVLKNAGLFRDLEGSKKGRIEYANGIKSNIEVR